MTDAWPTSTADREEARKLVETKKRQAWALVSKLDAGETVMLRQIVSGWSSKQIASELGIDDALFQQRKGRLLAKLNARSTVDAVRIGIYADLDP